MSEVCPICADDLTNKYTHTLECNHVFHYECLFYSFKKGKNLDLEYISPTNQKIKIKFNLDGFTKAFEKISQN